MIKTRKINSNRFLENGFVTILNQNELNELKFNGP